MNYEAVTIESQKYSYWGNRILQGDCIVLRNLYGRIWKEPPVLIKMFSQLQFLITAVEVLEDTNEVYSPEFLYYWAMVCVGEQSHLIPHNLGTAEICLRKIIRVVPKAEARLAYIGLLQSDEPAKSERNVSRIDVLRRWAGKRDVFSSIVLAKIIFYQFLNECETDVLELPVIVLRLLEYPCQIGHPVAIRFYNSMMECIGTPEAIGMKIDEAGIGAKGLFDFETAANIQLSS